jgi:hypothetical protein
VEESFFSFFSILEEVFGGKKERKVGRFGRRTESKKRRKGLFLLIENGLRVLECRKFAAAFDVRLFQILFFGLEKMPGGGREVAESCVDSLNLELVATYCKRLHPNKPELAARRIEAIGYQVGLQLAER